MEFRDVVRKRRMVRNYTTEPVDPAVVERMLEHAIRAPSAGFSQGWAFLLLDTPGDVRRSGGRRTPEGAADTWSRGMNRAPVVIVALSCKDAYLDRYAEPDKGWTDRDEARWPAPYWDIDTGMAALLVLLTAVDEGLGACFFGVPPDRIDAFRASSVFPTTTTRSGRSRSATLPRSKCAGRPQRGRRSVDEVVHRGRW